MASSNNSSGKNGLSCEGTSDRKRNVWLYDPFSFTPWYTTALALALKESKTDVRLLCGYLVQEPEYYKRVGLEPEVGLRDLTWIQNVAPSFLNRLLRLSQAASKRYTLIRDLQEHRTAPPDILHLQQLPMLDHGFRSDFKLIDAAKRAGVPVVHTVHNVLPHNHGEHARNIYAELYARADHLICHSSYASQRLIREFGIPLHKLTVIPHGPLFAPEHFPSKQEVIAARKHLNLPLDRIVVLWQGVLSGYKGLDVLLDAWKSQVEVRNFPGAARPLLVIAGSGPAQLEANIRKAASHIGESVCAELRYIQSDELSLFYTAADILVYPYRAITTSGALLTGLSYGKPIIASRLEPFQEYLHHGENALLVEAGNVDDLGAALSELICATAAMKSQHNADSENNIFCKLASGAATNLTRYVGWSEIATMTNALYEHFAERRDRIR